MARVTLVKDADRTAIHATNLRAFAQRNKAAADAVAASNLPPAAKTALAEVFLEIRQMARVIGMLARAVDVAPQSVPETDS